MIGYVLHGQWEIMWKEAVVAYFDTAIFEFA